MPHSTEVGPHQFKPSLTILWVSCPAKSQITTALADAICETVKVCAPVEALDLLGLGAVLIPWLVAGADVSEKFKLFSLQDGVGSWVRIGGHKRLLQSRLLGGRGLPPLTVFGLTAATATAHYWLYQRPR
jgi:hypothetical protein